MKRHPLLQAWIVVGLLWVVAALNYLDRVMLTTMRGSLVDAIPMTEAQFGLLTSVFLWVYAILSPVTGYLADRFSRSRVIIISLLFWSAFTWLTGHAKTFEQLLAIRALMGVSEATYIPAALALISDYHRSGTRSLATGIHMTGVSAGQALGGLGGSLAEQHTWNYPFLLFGAIGIVFAVLLFGILRDAPREGGTAPAAGSGQPEEKAAFGEALRSLLSQRQFYFMLGYWGLLGMVGWAVVGWVPTYLQEHFNLSQSKAGWLATVPLQIAMALGLLTGGAWADRWSRTNPHARFLVPIIGLGVAAPAVFLLSQTSVLTLAIVGLIGYGFGRTFTDSNMMPVLCLVADPRYRATGYGLLNFCSCTIGGLSNLAGGMLRDAHVNVSLLFLCSSVSMLVCAALMAGVKPARRVTVG